VCTNVAAINVQQSGGGGGAGGICNFRSAVDISTLYYSFLYYTARLFLYKCVIL
jgi:hypothetical protein